VNIRKSDDASDIFMKKVSLTIVAN